MIGNSTGLGSLYHQLSCISCLAYDYAAHSHQLSLPSWDAIKLVAYLSLLFQQPTPLNSIQADGRVSITKLFNMFKLAALSLLPVLALASPQGYGGYPAPSTPSPTSAAAAAPAAPSAPPSTTGQINVCQSILFVFRYAHKLLD